MMGQGIINGLIYTYQPVCCSSAPFLGISCLDINVQIKQRFKALCKT